MASADSPHLVRKSLTEALALRTGEADLYIFRDYRTQLQYIRSGRQMTSEGLFAELSGYQYQAFLDWREIHDSDGSWRRLMHLLNGAGTHDIDDSHRELQLQPVLGPLRSVVNAESLRAVNDRAITDDLREAMPPDVFLDAVTRFLGGSVVKSARADSWSRSESKSASSAVSSAVRVSKPPADWVNFIGEEKILAPVLAAGVLEEACSLKTSADQRVYLEIAFDRLENWHLRKAVAGAFAEYHHDEYRGDLDSLLVAVLVTSENILNSTGAVPDWLFDNPYLKRLLAVNVHQDIEWFSKEGWDRLIRAYCVQVHLRLSQDERDNSRSFLILLERARYLIAAGEQSGYQFARLKDLLGDQTGVKPKGP